jgi:hypothetical protein
MAICPFKPHSKKIFIILQKGSLILLFLFSGCSGLEQSEQDKLREHNARGEYVYRHQNEVVYPLTAPRPRQPEQYPWETSDKK